MARWVMEITQLSGGLPADREGPLLCCFALIMFGEIGGTRTRLRLWPVTEK